MRQKLVPSTQSYNMLNTEPHGLSAQPDATLAGQTLEMMHDDYATSSMQALILNTLGAIPWRPILQRVPGGWYIGLILLIFLGPVYAPIIFSVYFLLMHAFFVINNVRTAMAVRTAYLKAKEHSTIDWVDKYCNATKTSSPSDLRHDLPMDSVVHVIVIPNYKEGMDTLCETLDVLSSHSTAISQYKVKINCFSASDEC